MSKNLTEAINDWLNEGGYPLELLTVKTFRELGFQCFKSPFFADAETEKPREIDVVARFYSNVESSFHLTYKIVIECKKSSKAFIVLCADAEEETIIQRLVFGKLKVGNRDDNFIASPFFAAFPKGFKLDFASLFSTPLLNQNTRRGYTIIQAHQSNDAHIYSEVYKLAKAYHYELQQELNYYEMILNDDHSNQTDKDEVQNSFHAHLPVLVVDAPLVEVHLDDEGVLRIEEKDISVVEIRPPWDLLENYDNQVAIAVVTKKVLSSFAKDVTTLTNEIVKWHDSEKAQDWYKRLSNENREEGIEQFLKLS